MDQWETKVDPSSGRPYYWNAAKGTSSWTNPQKEKDIYYNNSIKELKNENEKKQTQETPETQETRIALSDDIISPSIIADSLLSSSNSAKSSLVARSGRQLHHYFSLASYQESINRQGGIAKADIPATKKQIQSWKKRKEQVKKLKNKFFYE
jgi:hypothetical protein